jgi:murein DD-endopeptidase MepM/ murein hydrolase activator NlpD
MQILITHGRMARSRVLNVAVWQVLLAVAAGALVLMMLSGATYHLVFLKAAREGWPVVAPLVRLVVRDEIEQRERFMRENLDALAERVGTLQAQMLQMQTVGERVAGLAGVKPEELAPLKAPGGPLSGSEPAPTTTAPKPAARGGGQGGPYWPWPLRDAVPRPSLAQLQGSVGDLEAAGQQQAEVWLLAESRLLEARLASLLLPSIAPVDGPVGSGFGFRADPMSGRAALHTGLDFPADIGTPIVAAAGGMVSAREWHPAYGQLLEIDHGNGLVTRYAHCSEILVAVGALVKKGQTVARVGNSGRSTGPHLHFEVLVAGVPQNPARFLAGGGPVAMREFAQRPGLRR